MAARLLKFSTHYQLITKQCQRGHAAIHPRATTIPVGAVPPCDVSSRMAIRLTEFTADEQKILAPYFTNLTGPVFALTNLPETVKGALFARYSRSAKSLRRLPLSENDV